MSQHSLAIQSAIYNTLRLDSVINGMVSGVYDDVPEGSSFPYITIGDDTAINAGSKSLDGIEYTLTLHVWSQYRGRKEVKEIMQRMYELLHDSDINVENANLVNIRQEFETSLVDSDGITRHGVMRFRAVVFDAN